MFETLPQFAVYPSVQDTKRLIEEWKNIFSKIFSTISYSRHGQWCCQKLKFFPKKDIDIKKKKAASCIVFLISTKISYSMCHKTFWRMWHFQMLRLLFLIKNIFPDLGFPTQYHGYTFSLLMYWSRSFASSENNYNVQVRKVGKK